MATGLYRYTLACASCLYILTIPGDEVVRPTGSEAVEPHEEIAAEAENHLVLAALHRMDGRLGYGDTETIGDVMERIRRAAEHYVQAGEQFRLSQRR